MKHDPNSKIRSQRENMQAYQLRLPKEVIRDIQILRVFAGIKVSEELRDLVIAYVNERQPLIKKTASEVIPVERLRDAEGEEDAQALVDGGDVDVVEMRSVGKYTVEVDDAGQRTVTKLPASAEEQQPVRAVVRKKPEA